MATSRDECTRIHSGPRLLSRIWQCKWIKWCHIFKVFLHYILFIKNKKQPDFAYQTCFTPTSQTGRCRFIQHCARPEMITTLNTFVSYACPIGNEWVDPWKFLVSTFALLLRWFIDTFFCSTTVIWVCVVQTAPNLPCHPLHHRLHLHRPLLLWQPLLRLHLPRRLWHRWPNLQWPPPSQPSEKVNIVNFFSI